jgi:hypothetical protein
MKRVIAVAACGFTLSACSSWMPSFDWSMPSLSGNGGGGAASLAIESDPPGAQASTQSGGSCVTPCRLNVNVTGPFTVNVALNGYIPQSVPVRVVRPDDPRLGSADAGSNDPHLDPNPLYVELQPAPPPPPPPRKVKPKHPPVARRAPPPPAAAQQPPPADAPSAPTTAAAPPAQPAPPPQMPPPQPNAPAPWPMPK